MAGAKEIKGRIKSVQSTHQITKAMEIVSTTKFKRFSALVTKSRPYAESIHNILSNIAAGVKSEKHPLFDGREEVKKIGVIVMTSDRGLCGGFNNNTLREMEKIMRKNSGKEVSVIAIGRKGREYCSKRKYDLKASYIQLIPETMGDKAKEISENIADCLSLLYFRLSSFIISSALSVALFIEFFLAECSLAVLFKRA